MVALLRRQQIHSIATFICLNDMTIRCLAICRRERMSFINTSVGGGFACFGKFLVDQIGIDPVSRCRPLCHGDGYTPHR
jgi:hypothetical protein